MRQITRNDIQHGARAIAVEIAYPEFVDRFGQRHSDHAQDWDSPGPVELWFFELPWGHKITLEYQLTSSVVNIYVESLEIEAVLEFLCLSNHEYFIDTHLIGLLKQADPTYTRDISPSRLYRMDDNGNTVLMHSYESRRVADYYQKVYEARGHKQLYWVEQGNG